MRFALFLIVVSGCFAAKPLEFPPNIDTMTRIVCDVQPQPDKPGFMPGWYVRIKATYLHEKEYERLLNVFPSDKLAKATDACASYLTRFKDEERKQKSKTVE